MATEVISIWYIAPYGQVTCSHGTFLNYLNDTVRVEVQRSEIKLPINGDEYIPSGWNPYGDDSDA